MDGNREHTPSPGQQSREEGISRDGESAVRRAAGEPAQRQGDKLESQILPDYLEERGRKPASVEDVRRRPER